MDLEQGHTPEEHLKQTESQNSLSIALRLEDSEDEAEVPEFEKISTKEIGPNVSRTGSAVQRVVTAQDWNGPDDPENPHNWPLWKRIWHIVQPALFGFAVTLGSSIYSPATREIAQEFHVSNTVSFLGISLWVLGLGFGPVLAAPLSETFGRLIVYRVTLPLSMLFTLGAGFSHSLGSLLICRFLAGLTGSPVLSVGAGTNADVFPPKDRATATSSFLLAPFLGSAVGPLVGGFVAQYKGWRWTQWVVLFASVVVYLLSLSMKETYKKAILRKRAKNLGLDPPRANLPPGIAGLKFLFKVTLIRPLHMLFLEPIVAFLSLYSAFTFGVLFAFISSFGYVFQTVYKFSISQTGMAFLGIIIGVILAVPTAILCDYYLYRPRHNEAVKQGKKVIAPEYRLYSAMIGSFGVTIGLFWYGWTARESVHWIVPILGTVLFAWGNLCIFSATALYCVDVYGPLNGASAMAANSLARYGLSAAFPLFTVQMYRNLGIGWASSLLGFLSLAMLPIPWILFKWGPKIRAKSSYDTLKV